MPLNEAGIRTDPPVSLPNAKSQALAPHAAAEPLEELFGAYTLNDNTAKDAARMLLTIHIKDYQPRKVVQDFEILREKGKRGEGDAERVHRGAGSSR